MFWLTLEWIAASQGMLEFPVAGSVCMRQRAGRMKLPGPVDPQRPADDNRQSSRVSATFIVAGPD